MPAPGVPAWVCYLLECADGTLYCGITNDLEKRLASHNAGEGAKYTRGRAPVKLAYFEACGDKPAALKRERAIKRLSRAEKLALCASMPAVRNARRARPAAGQEAVLTNRREKR